jgi:hypothetical protein
VPRLRHLIELAAMSRLLVSLVGFAVPAFGMTVITWPFLSATLVVTGIFLLRICLTRPGLPQVLETEITVTKRTGHSRMALERFLAQGIQSVDPVGGATLLDYDIRDLGHVREVRLTATRPAMSHYEWVSAWIDDAAGRMADRMIPALVPGRVSAVTGPAPVP